MGLQRSLDSAALAFRLLVVTSDPSRVLRGHPQADFPNVG